MSDTTQDQAAKPAKKGAAKKVEAAVATVTREEFEALKGHVDHLTHRLAQHGINVHRAAKPVAAAPKQK